MAKGQKIERCYLCATELVRGHPSTRTNSRSKMHYGHNKNKGRKAWHAVPQATWDAMDVKNHKGKVVACYECHEVVCHNPVLNEKQLTTLAGLFNGKKFDEKVILFNRIIDAGLKAVANKSSA